MGEEFGPWIEHDGNGCPCVGEYVQAVHDSEILRHTGSGLVYGNVIEGIATGGKSWFWCSGYTHVMRYRIRKPKGLTILTDILREVERDGDKVYGDLELEECRV